MFKTCAVCGNEFKVKPSHYAKRTTCGRECMAQLYRETLRGTANPNYRGVADGTGKHNCLTCGKEFVSYFKTAKFCSSVCSANYPPHRERSRERMRVLRLSQPRKPRPPKVKPRRRKARAKDKRWTWTCCACGKVGYSTIGGNRRYCDDCAVFRPGGMGSLVQRGKVCAVCGHYFESVNDKKTCSKECRRLHQAAIQEGEKSHRWRGGRTSESLRVRCSVVYSMWREQVFQRDDFTCQMCGERGGRLAAHHIKPFAIHPDLRMTVDNGITLCWACHASIKNKEQEHEQQFQAIVAVCRGAVEAVHAIERYLEMT